MTRGGGHGSGWWDRLDFHIATTESSDLDDVPTSREHLLRFAIAHVGCDRPPDRIARGARTGVPVHCAIA
ncbi:MAG: hypothetical protein M3071_13955 [Actinomycetota bacterium]|nr:hypothetical protein [Actinomycetota bacterium]